MNLVTKIYGRSIDNHRAINSETKRKANNIVRQLGGVILRYEPEVVLFTKAGASYSLRLNAPKRIVETKTNQAIETDDLEVMRRFVG